MNGLRKVAMRLSPLGERDRRWMLDKLDVEARERVEALLVELDRLGLNGDVALEDVLAGGAPFVADGRSDAESDPSGAIARADVGALLAVFDGEPDVVVARIAASRPWVWRRPLLEALPADRRARVEALMARGAAPSSRIVDVLFEALARRLEAFERGEIVVSFESELERASGTSKAASPGMMAALSRRLGWAR